MTTENSNVKQQQDQKTGSLAWLTVLAGCALSLSFLIGFSMSKLTGNTKLFNSVQFDVSISEASDIAWVQRVADSQSLYVNNTIDAISTNSIISDALLASLLRSPAITPKVPDLTKYGYNYVSVQELKYEETLLVQLLYKKTSRKPLALSFMASEGKAKQDLRLARHEELGSASWRSSRQRFVLVAEEPTEPLTAIANYIQKVIFETRLGVNQTASTANAIP